MSTPLRPPVPRLAVDELRWARRRLMLAVRAIRIACGWLSRGHVAWLLRDLADEIEHREGRP